ncbi:unnamed protein product [Nippostrongylus brasiliensis]|uniref:ZM domain-containing protein n=1 Tax=Nippostrongylus brasiliensis TaxID=27835 RepID=A0A0N4YGQ9_NIPBR|nr:unnamed protein product [Nippostrongylus brasiliensis]
MNICYSPILFVQVSDRRSVADLRRQITQRLEMKAPESSSRCPSRADSNCSPVPSRHFNNHNFIKVHEGAEPDVKPSKPWLGRVLDGPVPPEKFYQGVMPPSLMQCASPVPAPVAKPPSPLPKPSKQKRNSFLNRIANESIPNDIPGYPADEYSNHVEQQRRPIQNAEQHLDEQHVSPYEQVRILSLSILHRSGREQQ